MKIIKALFVLSVFVPVVLLAQNNSKKSSFLNASLYEKEFELIHTKLEVSFDIPKELLFGKE